MDQTARDGTTVDGVRQDLAVVLRLCPEEGSADAHETRRPVENDEGDEQAAEGLVTAELRQQNCAYQDTAVEWGPKGHVVSSSDPPAAVASQSRGAAKDRPQGKERDEVQDKEWNDKPERSVVRRLGMNHPRSPESADGSVVGQRSWGRGLREIQD